MSPDSSKIPPQMLIVASPEELSCATRLWGTGGWLSPANREGLDWLTFSKLMGWGASVARPNHRNFDTELVTGARWIVLACDPDSLDENSLRNLENRLATGTVLLLARAGEPRGRFANLAGAFRAPEVVTGRNVRWIGPGRERAWRCRKVVKGHAVGISDDVVTWATLEDGPVVVARRVGRGVIATIGFHPSDVRDLDGAGTSLLKHLLIWGALAPVAWFDLEGSLVLRMDDPGGSQNVFKKDWCYPKLTMRQWDHIGGILTRRNGRMSVGYIIGWVDDGDEDRGKLEVAYDKPNRVPGNVYPSPLVRYWDLEGHARGTHYDYQDEYRGIQKLRAAGLADVEMHGFTHMHPDRDSWASAPDRYEATAWYREFGSATEAIIDSRPRLQHPLALGIDMLHRYFGAHPTTLICPGDEFTDSALENALDLGIYLVGSYYLAIRHDDRFAWCTHVCAPYLDEPNAAWFDAELPVVGYFHDRDIALQGVRWMSQCLDRWERAGARKFIDYRELAAVVGRQLNFDSSNRALSLKVTRDQSAPPIVRPLSICVKVPHGALPLRLDVTEADRTYSVDVSCSADGIGHACIWPDYP